MSNNSRCCRSTIFAVQKLGLKQCSLFSAMAHAFQAILKWGLDPVQRRALGFDWGAQTLFAAC
jgi:hypothetical protein